MIHLDYLRWEWPIILSVTKIMVSLNFKILKRIQDWNASGSLSFWGHVVRESPGSALKQYYFFGAKDTIFLVIESLAVFHMKPAGALLFLSVMPLIRLLIRSGLRLVLHYEAPWSTVPSQFWIWEGILINLSCGDVGTSVSLHYSLNVSSYGFTKNPSLVTLSYHETESHTNTAIGSCVWGM